MLGTVVLAGALTACGTTGQPTGSGSVSASPEGWFVTVYYTPVEHFHGGDPVAVRGRPSLTSETETDLGSHPSGFVEAVRGEGGGRISTGPHAGEYLNWSWNTGFWLDTSTRDAGGDPLVPFETAAVDGVERGTPLRLLACGVDGDGSPAASAPCRRLGAADWVVRDEFTPGLGGEQHVDLYIGEETGPDFTESDLWVAWSGAAVTLDPEG